LLQTGTEGVLRAARDFVAHQYPDLVNFQPAWKGGTVVEILHFGRQRTRMILPGLRHILLA
jgi:hypothetical protein